MDLLDYSPDASGMTYRNSAMTSEVPVDGVPDVVPTARSSWEMVRGAQGSLISVAGITSDQRFRSSSFSTYYLDDASPDGDQCTGDGSAYGVSGLRLTAGIANTDPRFNPPNRFRGTRVLTYRPPGATVAQARVVRQQVEAPLQVTARPFA